MDPKQERFDEMNKPTRASMEHYLKLFGISDAEESECKYEEKVRKG